MTQERNMMEMDAGSPVRSNLPFIVCLFGLFLLLFLSPPLLDSIGFHYASDAGAPYEKIHPATYFIFLAFVLFLRGGKSVLSVLNHVIRQRLAGVSLLCLYLLILIYLVLRDGIGGCAFIINGHIVVPICAIILSYVPYNLCKSALKLSLLFVTLNSFVGILEGVFRFRLLPFSEDTTFAKELYFRSSAILGHPLSNATFTSAMLLVIAAIPIRLAVKIPLIILMMLSLVAFGGRSGLLFSLFFLTISAVVQLRQYLRQNSLSVRQSLSLTILSVGVPIVLLTALVALVNSSAGERILAYSDFKDDSAGSRLLALDALSYAKDDELLFGMSNSRILDITDRMGQKVDIKIIENPWLLMLMTLGVMFFTLWLFTTIWFLSALVQGHGIKLTLVLVSYFLVATSFNSFASKDINYPAIVAITVLAALYMRGQKINSAKLSS